MVDPTEVGEAYDEASPMVSAVGDGQFHLWYWYGDEDDVALSEAMRRITRKVAGTLALSAGQRVLDAGCGSGAPAIQLAIETGSDVTGITISGVQAAEARSRAERSEAADHVRFEYGDYTKLDHQDDSFDAVVALESLQCAPDLSAVLEEFHRVLRPGGRITIAEFSKERLMDDASAARFAANIGINTLQTLDDWLEQLQRAGFEVDEYTQCGPRVFGRRKWKYFDQVRPMREELREKFGEDALEGFDAGLRPFFASEAEHLGYVIVTASKPRHPERDDGPESGPREEH